MSELQPNDPERAVPTANVPASRYFALLIGEAVKETLGFVRRASSDSLIGSFIFWITPVGVLGFFIYQARGPREFREWLVAVLVTAATLIACFFFLFLLALLKSPLTIYRRLLTEKDRFIGEIQKASQTAIESRDLELSKERTAFDSHLAECKKVKHAKPEKRPDISLSTTLCEGSLRFKLENFGDEVAINIRCEITIPHTDYLIRFERRDVRPAIPDVFLPELYVDGDRAYLNVYWPVESFMKEARWLSGVESGKAALQAARAGQSQSDESIDIANRVAIEEICRKQGIDIGVPTIVDFDVVYVGFSGKWRYRKTHTLTYDPKKAPSIHDLSPNIRIDVASVPEPAPEPIL